MKSIPQFWDSAIVPTLVDYIRIPAKSPHFDKDWAKNGHIEAAVTLAAEWCRKHPVEGMQLEVVRLPKRTPLLFIEVPATKGAKAGTVLLYGHLDKQPEMTGWAEGTGPWIPVTKNGRLYGRGGADDGYAVFASIAALRALQQEKKPHARTVIVIECCEESGSTDLPAYLEALAPRVGAPALVVGLDSGCGNYEQLWGTTSLRGLVNGVLTLLERVEEAATGRVREAAFQAPVPAERVAQAKRAAGVLGKEIHAKFPFVPGMRPMAEGLEEMVLNRTWRAALSVTGAEGLPLPANAGNVLRPRTSLALSLRIPPTVNGEKAAAKLKEILEADPPYGARVSFDAGQAATGWHAPITAPWLEKAIDEASQKHFGKPAMWMGEGGTIPFMAMLGEKFPQAQFLITGVLGPHSNAHGPNEFLDIEYAKKLTAAVADVLAAQAVAA